VVKFYVYIIVFVFTGIQLGLGQGELQEHQTYNFNESTFALFLNSNGYGINYTYGKRLDGFRRATFSLDLTEIKHPKEIRTSNPYFDTQKKFIFGKMNNLYTLKVSFGFHKTVFDKFDKGGIGIGYHLQIGPNIGILKPIYYQVLYPTSDPGVYSVQTEQFNYSIHRVNDIYGKASYFEGVEQTKLRLGGFARMTVDFDFGESDYFVNRLECGVQLDGFLQEMEIMATEKSSHLFLSVFVAYRFGKILETKLNKQ